MRPLVSKMRLSSCYVVRQETLHRARMSNGTSFCSFGCLKAAIGSWPSAIGPSVSFYRCSLSDSENSSSPPFGISDHGDLRDHGGFRAHPRYLPPPFVANTRLIRYRPLRHPTFSTGQSRVFHRATQNFPLGDPSVASLVETE